MHTKEFTAQDYIKEFEKKFTGFCQRAPVYLSFKCTPARVYIENVPSGQVFEFEVNTNTPVEQFIFEIRQFLRKEIYPKFTIKTVENVEPSVEDITKLTRQGMSFDRAFRRLSYLEKHQSLAIDKIDLKKNTVVVLNEDSGKQEVYHLEIPVVSFLKKYRENKLEDPGKTFLDYSTYLYSVGEE